MEREAGEVMLAALGHRGPDERGLHVASEAAFGQTRLSVIDLETGRQPIVSPDGRYWLVCNGEIYNHEELRRRLQEDGCRFQTRSDSEVILHLYQRLGRDCLNLLRGMFAFAIWDSRERELFAARDPLGQKPFYYAADSKRLVFASEIKALTSVEPGLAELDLESLDQYLGLRLIAAPRSMFRGIRKLAPGRWLRFRFDRGLEIGRYWEPVYEPKVEGSEAELADELEEVLTDACRVHLTSDVPVGAYLSGGLDSSLLVALLVGNLGRRDLQTFTMGLPHGRFDEAPAASTVANLYATDHHEETVHLSLLGTLPSIVWHLDEPSDALAVPTYYLARLAGRHVKVVIGGDGGDEAFGGYDRYYANQYAALYGRIPAPVRRAVIGSALDHLPDGRWYKSPTHQMKWLHRASFLEPASRYADSLTYFHFSRAERAELFSDGLAEIRDSRAEGPLVDVYRTARANHPIDRMLATDTAIRLPDHPAMVTDRMGMAHGLEVRSPYMDQRVVEFAARLPVEMKVRGRGLRYLQRVLARRHLPPEILRRPKQGFSSALPYMLKSEYELLYSLFLARSSLASEKILEQPVIDVLMKAHNSGRRDHRQRLWLLLNAEIWYRMSILGQSRSDLDAQIDEEFRRATR